MEKTKLIFLLLTSFVLRQTGASQNKPEGCGSFRLNISTSSLNAVIYAHGNESPFPNFFLNPNDSMLLSMGAIGCSAIMTTIKRNDSLINSNPKIYEKIKCYPGHYVVGWKSLYVYPDYKDFIQFYLINNTYVNIKETELDASLFSISPNPAQEAVTFKCGIMGLKNITIYNSIGEVMTELNEELYNLTLPTHTYSSGIYFVKFSMQNNQKLIKKLIIL